MPETWAQSLGKEDLLEKKKAPTPVFLPGEFHAQTSLVGYSPWDLKESDTTEQLRVHIYSEQDSAWPLLVLNPL